MPWEDGTPKADLHRHFGGCISPALVTELLGQEFVGVTGDLVKRRMRCLEPAPSFYAFLEHFDILNEVNWTERNIERSVEQVVRDQAADNIDYAELSFSIDKYINNHVKWTRAEAICHIADIFDTMCRTYGTLIGLVLSLKMESSRDSQRINAALITRSIVADRLVGLDVVGDEHKLCVDFYQPIFRDWRHAGKVVLAHAGETCGPQNVFDAITKLYVHRVRHGIAAVRDPNCLAAAKDLDVCFDVSLHSNWLAGTVPDMRRHHLPKLLAAGCAATLGTDDPAIFNCVLADEYKLGSEHGLFGDTPERIAATIARLRTNSVMYSARHGVVQRLRGNYVSS